MKNRKSFTFTVIFVLLFLTFCSLFSIVFARETSQPIITTSGLPLSQEIPIQSAKTSSPNTSRSSTTSLADLDNVSLATGIYHIKNAGTNYYVDIHGPSPDSGGLIHQWSFHPNLYENWIVEALEVSDETYYSFKSPYSDMYIGIENLSQSSANIKQYPTISNKTLWKVLKDSSNRYVLVPQQQYQNSVVLTAPSSIKGAELIQSSFSNDINQFWYLYHQEFIASDIKYIQNVQTRRYADLRGPSTSAGAVIQQWDLNRDNSSAISSWRKWIFELQDDYYYTIKNIYSGKYLGIDTSTSPVSIKQYSAGTADNVRWKVFTHSETDESTHKNKYVLTPKGYGYEPFSHVLSVADSSNSLGTSLHLLLYNHDTNDRDEWIFSEDIEYYGSIPAWNSDGISVAYWNKNVALYLKTLGNVDNSLSLSIAREQWDSAIPISLSIASSQSRADIICYNGSRTEVNEELNISNKPHVLGMCVGDSTRIAFVNFGNEIKYLKQVTNVYCYVYNDQRLHCIMTHEIGHALGYLDHSTFQSDIMQPGAQMNYVLSDREKDHLAQGYNFFYP